jgi:LysR family transcriptional regulator for bpeEF and oprC
MAVRAFTRVVETGSFVKAAASLELPRNTVTKLVQALEAHLRVKLLNRTTRRVSTTSDGTAYYERMARILDEWQEAESALASSQASPRGRLRVDMGAALATMLVIPALPGFQARYPDLQIDIGASDRPVDLVSDRVDCVVRAGRISDPSLIARHLADQASITCATPAYLARHGVPTHPSELEHGHQLVRYFFAGSGRRQPLFLRRGEQELEVKGRYFVGVNDANAMLVAGLAGLGILHAPAFMAQPHIASGLLVPVLRDWSAERTPVSIVYSPNRHLSTRVRVFVDWMVELLRDT